MVAAYPDAETKVSRAYLDVVDAAAVEPVCLLGGWAVYFTVNEAFRRLFQREYAFSRDIDVGFQLQAGWGREDIERSSFARTMRALKSEKFVAEGFRLRRDFGYDDQRPLTPEEAKRRPLHDLVPLYVDMMVDRPHPRFREVFGFEAAEEIELQAVFGAADFSSGPRFGERLILPPRASLIRMKMKALPERSKSHKVHKDLADLFALAATYGGPREGLRASVGRPDLAEGAWKVAATLHADDWAEVTSFTGVPAETVRPVLRSLVQ